MNTQIISEYQGEDGKSDFVSITPNGPHCTCKAHTDMGVCKHMLDTFMNGGKNATTIHNIATVDAFNTKQSLEQQTNEALKSDDFDAVVKLATERMKQS